ncbi:MAG TPA: tRNA (adenosine(37)-N6)-dimethylallyltransferase MiaA [Sphingomicrobium sp.]|jgi:tRNA dimethylallyltransferase|nr:tRNA (adenosine(37)-N6)-dimethylallyltransferase MiaA [Sphingomicrobium sp.]
MSPSKPPVVLIAGPTASGKSALALALAQQIGGVIVNADSAQIYRDLRVLSAAPTDEELQQAEHRLYGIQDGSLPCSAAEWAELARRELADIHSRGRTPILVGGTGLYLRTLLDGIAPVPAIDAEIRDRVRATSVEENAKKLEAFDPRAAVRLKPGDSARINRALEVVLSTGRTLAEWQHQREGGIANQVSLRPIILLPPRKWLYARCDERFSHMIDQGAVSEVEELLARALNPNLPVMRAIGVRELSAYLLGESTLDEAVAAGRQATRRYAKRQYTWFAHQPPAEWPRFQEALDLDTLDAALALMEP